MSRQNHKLLIIRQKKFKHALTHFYMKIIIPMAGRGSRLRPHTLTVPKPLVPVAGKPIVQRIAEDLAAAQGGQIEEIAFIIAPDFGTKVEADLKATAAKLGAKGSIYYQDKPLGTAHAVLCAKESLSGNCIVAFADTLFDMNFKLDTEKDAVIWVQRVDDPSAFGVIELHEEGYITNFVEKPETFVSDMAIIGIYYFRDGEYLKNELQYLLDNDIKEKGEYQLTNALENMRAKGTKFYPGEITEWLDCGNKNAVVYSNQRILELNKGTKLVNESATVTNSIVKQPCYIGAGAVIENSVVGPHVSIGENTVVTNSILKNTVVQDNTKVENAILENSMLGNHVTYSNQTSEISIGDYTQIK